ncbi:hypothetical protein [Salipiger thiooxidans]|uniref:hypothetical protein n=1 Tax=Salipiger thiooxidans TaxID=282683 RepID=UPI0013F4D09D|nr:hypothetical protein [Salipiger thiooxidans]
MRRFFLTVLFVFVSSLQALAQDSGASLLQEFSDLSERIKTLEDQNFALIQRLDGLEPDVTGPTQPISQIKQAVAQGACLGIHSNSGESNWSGWVRAVHRPYASPNGWIIDRPDDWLPVEEDLVRVTCDTVCDQLIDHPASSMERYNNVRFSCFSSLHLYDDAPMDSEQAVTGLKAHYYSGGCSHPRTGPNYCCCRTVP